MDDIYSRLISWFSYSEKSNWASELADIVRSCEKSLVPVWHPLGFIHVKLAQGVLGDTFRMHLWSAQCRSADEQEDKIHDHLFNVKSRVVFGGVRNAQYRFIPRIDGGHREVRIKYGSNGVVLQEGNVFGDIEPVSADVLMAPAEYSISRMHLHETSIFASESALTVVHTTDPLNINPRAIFSRESPLPPVRSPMSCDRLFWRARLEKMLPIHFDD